MSDISVTVLAGGKSRRLGLDKSMLKIHDTWLLQRILDTLARLSDDLIIVASPRPEFAALPARVVPDELPDMGALGGIYSGLKAMRYERGLFVACDMPFLNLPLLRFMILLSPDFDVVVPCVADQTEPLHAIYSKRCAEPISQLLQHGELRIAHLYPQVRVRYVTEMELEVFDPQHLSFLNINTPADLGKTCRLMKATEKPPRRSPG
jgi:molybdopterin-guanine dinucleotide biosynthesis protein A